MSFNGFGWEMILADEQTVVTSCMQFTKTLQKRWLPIASWVIYRILDHKCVSSCVTGKKQGEKGLEKMQIKFKDWQKCIHIYS